MENTLRFQANTGIKNIDITNERDEVVYTLRVNVADSTTAERFANIIKNLEHVSDEFEKEAKVLYEKYDKDDTTDAIVAKCRIHVNYLERCIEELDKVFGDGTIKNVYKECYELNPNFVPDEDALIEFVEGVIPIMGQLFNERFETYRSKYNTKRKGAHTKSKDELIKALKATHE